MNTQNTKNQLLTGFAIKDHNGSGYSLAKALPKRRFHDKTIYKVSWDGVRPDCSNITAIVRARKGWETK